MTAVETSQEHAALEYLQQAHEARREIVAILGKLGELKVRIAELELKHGVTQLKEERKALKKKLAAVALDTINASGKIQLPLFPPPGGGRQA